MKKVVNYSVLLVLGIAILSVMACTHRDLETRNIAEMSALDVYGGVSSATKAVDQTWSVGDQIGVISSDPEGYHNACYVLDETQPTTSGHFSAAEDHTIYLGGSETVIFTAYGPYHDSTGPDAYPGDDGVISGISTASQSSVETQETIDFLYASGQGASSDNPKVNFTFTHQMAKLVLKVVYGEGLSATIIRYDDNDFYLGGLCHTGSFTVTDGTAKAEGTTDEGWNLAANAMKEDIDDGLQFTSIIFPQATNLTFTVKINDEEFDPASLTVPQGGFTSGNAYIYTITVNENGLIVGTSDEGCVITAWDVLGGDDDEDYQVHIGGN